MMFKWQSVVSMLVLTASLGWFAAPASAGHFDDPFNGTVITEIVALDLAGSVPGFGDFTATWTASAPGSITVDTRDANAGGASLAYLSSSPLGDFEIPLNLFSLVPSTATVGNFGGAVSYPLPAVSPVPPVGAKLGAMQNFGLGGGNVLNADMITLNSLASTVNITGGHAYTYNATMHHAAFISGVGDVIVGLDGMVTFNSIPEPASFVMFGAGLLPLLARRGRR